jgi:hypothetical protein
MNRMTCGAKPIPRQFATAGALVLALAVASLAGCGQEGKTIQTDLPVLGVAYDATVATVSTDTTSGAVTATANVKFKVLTTYANGCEARGGLELRRENPAAPFLYVITPLARYTADEECNIGAAGDTLQTITVRSLSLRLPPSGSVDSVARFEVRGFGAPPIRFDLHFDDVSNNDMTTGFYVNVEDKDTGAPIDGANVRVERFGTPDVLSEGPTAGGGRYAFDVPCAGTAGEDHDRYVVKVSYAGRITIFRAAEHPALCKRREIIFVRV